jgi:spore coat protein U-like protein
MRKISFAVAAAAMIGASSSAFAAQANDGFVVKVVVNANCIVVANDVDFGTITQVAGTETASGTVSVRCSKSTPFTLSLSPTAAVTTATGTLAGAIAGNTDTVAYSVTLSGSSGTGAGMGVAQAVAFNINGALTAAAPTLTPDTYSAARTLYVNY